MKTGLLIAFSTLCGSCASQPIGDPCGLGLTPDQLVALKANVRSYLRDELAGAYAYFDTEDTSLNAVVTFDGSCAILFYPAKPQVETPLAPSGFLLFDEETLQPVDVSFNSQ